MLEQRSTNFESDGHSEGANSKQFDKILKLPCPSVYSTP